jgi:uncharacterized protein YbjT (DUF2867 family)
MILVTGANGKAASEVVRGLSANGMPVRALVRSLANAKSIEGPGVEIVQGDLAQVETLPRILEGVDAVFLATGLAPDMAELHRNLIEAATRGDVRHIVRLSVLPAAIDAPIRGPRLHGEADQALIESGIPYTLVKPAHFMQNLLAFAGPIAAQGLIPAPLGQAAIGTIDVRDVAAVAVAALTGAGHAGQSYVVTGPEALTMAAMAERLSSALGREVRYADVPPEAARQALLGSGAPEWFVEALLEINANMASGSADVVTSTVREVTGQEPRSFEAFASDYASAFQPADETPEPAAATRGRVGN